jgi:hypothetical protein
VTGRREKRNRHNTLADQILAEMQRALSAGHELALHDAVVYCQDAKTPLPMWVADGLASRFRKAANGEKAKKKIGRHASPLEQQRQMFCDAYCFEIVRDLREDNGLKWVDAFEKASSEVNLSAEAVRKAYYRAKKRLISKNYYLSYLYLQNSEER